MAYIVNGNWEFYYTHTKYSKLAIQYIGPIINQCDRVLTLELTTLK